MFINGVSLSCVFFFFLRLGIGISCLIFINGVSVCCVFCLLMGHWVIIFAIYYWGVGALYFHFTVGILVSCVNCLLLGYCCLEFIAYYWSVGIVYLLTTQLKYVVYFLPMSCRCLVFTIPYCGISVLYLLFGCWCALGTNYYFNVFNLTQSKRHLNR